MCVTSAPTFWREHIELQIVSSGTQDVPLPLLLWERPPWKEVTKMLMIRAWRSPSCGGTTLQRRQRRLVVHHIFLFLIINVLLPWFRPSPPPPYSSHFQRLPGFASLGNRRTPHHLPWTQCFETFFVMLGHFTIYFREPFRTKSAVFLTLFYPIVYVKGGGGQRLFGRWGVGLPLKLYLLFATCFSARRYCLQNKSVKKCLALTLDEMKAHYELYLCQDLSLWTQPPPSVWGEIGISTNMIIYSKVQISKSNSKRKYLPP